MFDRHYHIAARGGHQTVSVTHKHAPTDESVRLLREMEQAARDKVVQALRLEDSPIDGVVHAHDDFLSQRREFCVLVRVNGRQLEVRRSFNFSAADEEIADGLLMAVSQRIAAELLSKAFSKLPAQFRRAAP